MAPDGKLPQYDSLAHDTSSAVCRKMIKPVISWMGKLDTPAPLCTLHHIVQVGSDTFAGLARVKSGHIRVSINLVIIKGDSHFVLAPTLREDVLRSIFAKGMTIDKHRYMDSIGPTRRIQKKP